MTQAQVQTGYVFPSAGVRVLIPLVVSAFMEEASGVSMNDMSDYNIGVSVGSVPAAAFSLNNPEQPDKPKFKAVEVLYSTLITAHLMFSRDPATVMANHVHRDVMPLLAKFFTSTLGQTIIQHFEKRKPSAESSRYDPRVLEAALTERFGTTRVSDAQKTFFIIAHGVNARTPSFFAHIDPEVYPRSPDMPLHIDNIPIHNNIAITEAIMSATAIPGLIGFRCVDSLSEHFMDPGSFSAQSYFSIMEDMHDLAAFKEERAHGAKLSARSKWQKIADMARTLEAAPKVVSRLVYLGIGDESLQTFDTTGETGIVRQAGDIVRAASDHVKGFSNAHISKRFDRASKAQTGMPAMRVIDAFITPQTDEERATFPSVDIKDGRKDNLNRLMAFGAKIAIENRDALCDEIILRMKTLQARGLKSADEVAAVTLSLQTFRDEAAATELCNRIASGKGLDHSQMHGLFDENLPAVVKPATPPSRVLEGWGIPTSVKQLGRASLSIFV